MFCPRNKNSINVTGQQASYLVFKRFEPTKPVWHITLLVAIPASLSPLLSPHVSNIFLAVGATFTVYIFTIVASIALYRLSPFHPLARYPGPILCKLSKFRMAWISMQGKQHIYYHELHERYGDVVRTGEFGSYNSSPSTRLTRRENLKSGPNEISIRNVAAVSSLMGSHGLPKGPSK